MLTAERLYDNINPSRFLTCMEQPLGGRKGKHMAIRGPWSLFIDRCCTKLGIEVESFDQAHSIKQIISQAQELAAQFIQSQELQKATSHCMSSARTKEELEESKETVRFWAESGPLYLEEKLSKILLKKRLLEVELQLAQLKSKNGGSQ